MTPRSRKLYSFWIDPAQAVGLKRIKERDVIPESLGGQLKTGHWSTLQNRPPGVAAETELYLLSFFVLPSLLTEVWCPLL